MRGAPCKKCGAVERYASNGRCVACRRENSRLWSAANRERHRERSRHWAAANPEKKAATNHRRRARKAAVLSIPLPPAVIDFGPWQPCAYCGSTPGSGRRSVREHMVPLCRGGSDERSNLTWACSGCNGRKGKQTMEEYLLPRYLKMLRQQLGVEDAA